MFWRFLSQTILAGVILTLGWPFHARAEKFLLDDPVLVDHDTVPIPKPQVREVSTAAEALKNTFLLKPGDETIPPAENINTLGGVPDSSWFTNRMSGPQPLSVAELVRGPDQSTGPDTTRPWRIIRAKTEGVSPGFVIEDSRGETYFLKFDPPGHPQLATSAEVIATKFLYAFGYNVPENYLVRVRRDIFEIDPKTKIRSAARTRTMTEKDVDRVLKDVPRLSDGTIQVFASKRVAGEVIGPFRYYGIRSDDPNDIFPHENRRELRALQVFAAWLSHSDLKSSNSLDVYLPMEKGQDEHEIKKDDRRGYVRHYLLDFGSALGSGGDEVKHPRVGHEHVVEGKPIAKSAVSLGLLDRAWWHLDYPEHPR